MRGGEVVDAGKHGLVRAHRATRTVEGSVGDRSVEGVPAVAAPGALLVASRYQLRRRGSWVLVEVPLLGESRMRLSEGVVAGQCLAACADGARGLACRERGRDLAVVAPGRSEERRVGEVCGGRRPSG